MIVVCPDPRFRQELVAIARRSPTPAAGAVRALASPDDLTTPAPRPSEVCVVAAPDSSDDPLAWLTQIQRHLVRPKVILLLPLDDPVLVPVLLQAGVFDLLYRRHFSPNHLRNTIALGANGARVPPYGAICNDTREFNPCPGAPWASVFREGTAAHTDRLDDRALRLLPRLLDLEPEALVFHEVPTGPSLDGEDTPSLVLALLSAEPAEDDQEVFLRAMRSQERTGHRLLYLHRAGTALPADLPVELRPPAGRTLRYFSACELLLRLGYGFGAELLNCAI
jgi:hypothetical protein